MGYVKTQADNALKAGNYKDAYTKCVIINNPSGSTLSASFLCLSESCLRQKKKKNDVCIDHFRAQAGTLTV